MLQGDCIRNITGKHTGEDDDKTVSSMPTGCFYSGDVVRGTDSGSNNHWWLHFDASRVVPTDTEVRPINKAVRYLIRAIATTES